MPGVSALPSFVSGYRPTQIKGINEWEHMISGAQMSAMESPGAMWKPIKTFKEYEKPTDVIYYGDEAVAYMTKPEEITYPKFSYAHAWQDP